MLEVKEVQTLSEQEKTISLFEFIKELNKLKQKVVLNIKDYPWRLAISDIPVFSEYIKVSYRDRVEEESETTDDLLLSIRKPEFEECPIPDELFADWLISGWDDYHTEAEVMPEQNITAENPDEDESPEKDVAVERFEDSPERVTAYQDWQVLRTAWADRQHIIEKTRELFTDLYQLYFELQREAETEEIIVANGMLRDAQNPDIAHPVLTHRVQLEYDAMENVISIHDTESSSELYSVLFQMMEGINLDAINHLNDDLRANDYHPLDRTSTPDFLKALVRQLSSDSIPKSKRIPNRRLNWQLLRTFLIVGITLSSNGRSVRIVWIWSRCVVKRWWLSNVMANVGTAAKKKSGRIWNDRQFWNDWAGVSFGFVAASIIALQRKRWNVLFPNLQLLVLSRKLLKTATAVNNEPLNC